MAGVQTASVLRRESSFRNQTEASSGSHASGASFQMVWNPGSANVVHEPKKRSGAVKTSHAPSPRPRHEDPTHQNPTAHSAVTAISRAGGGLLRRTSQ